MRSWGIAVAVLLMSAPLAWSLDRPKGSYRKTCHDPLVSGPILEARCERKDGSTAISMINFWNCESPIENIDGRLTCTQRIRWRLPRGSYKETCRHIRLHRNTLDAECRKRNGKWRETSLNVKHCHGSIVNQNGKLTCD